MAAEEAEYTVIRKADPFEVRAYEPHIIAETLVEGDLEDAGGKAFRRLFKYISGENSARQEIAMTSPVGQAAPSQKIAMTSPVGQMQVDDRWAVSFMMPNAFTMETTPAPKDPDVVLRQVPSRNMAAVRYSGFWSEKSYQDNKRALEEWIGGQGLAITGEPIWARYNPPFTPWFLRRNEILIPIGDLTKPE